MRLIRARDEQGFLERELPNAGWYVPAGVSLAGESLEYLPLAAPARLIARSPKRLLDDFLDLADAPAETIEAFAQRRGVLGLCSHGLPAGHESLRARWAARLAAGRQLSRRVHTVFDTLAAALMREQPAMLDEPCFASPFPQVASEPLTLWRVYANLAQVVIETAGRAHEDAGALRATLDDWLALAPLRPGVSVERGRLSLELRSVHPLSALFGNLGIQVFLAASAGGPILVCSGCGRFYQPPRKPRTGSHTYCPECGKKAAWRDASRRYYHKRNSKDGE